MPSGPDQSESELGVNLSSRKQPNYHNTNLGAGTDTRIKSTAYLVHQLGGYSEERWGARKKAYVGAKLVRENIIRNCIAGVLLNLRPPSMGDQSVRKRSAVGKGGKMFVLSPTDNRRGHLCRPASLDLVGPVVAAKEITKTTKVGQSPDEDVARQQCG